MEIEMEAVPQNLPQLLEWIETRLEEADCPPKTQMQIAVAAEEIFVNIANYAYAPGTGRVTARMDISGEPPRLSITFIDSGVPYDPLSRVDPDLSLPVEQREVGGLGIYMTKKFMDSVSYEYIDGCNVFTMKKYLS